MWTINVCFQRVAEECNEAEAVGNPSEEVTYFDRDSSWDLEVQEFIKAIDEQKPVTISSSTDALRVMEIIEKAYVDAAQPLQGELNEEHCRLG